MDEPLRVDPSATLTRPPAAIFAALQAFAVSGIPTQVVIAAILIVGAGMPPFGGGALSLQFIATVSLFDTALVAILIRIFLGASGETSRDVYLGRGPAGRELVLGLALVPPVFLAVVALVAGLRAIAPWLQTVDISPLAAFMQTPLDVAIFTVVVVLAGGVREELQRGFILHRFGQRLGGAWVGNLVYGIAFGLLHLDQGADVAIVIGLMGLGWGLLYLRRRSIVASMANHAGFNFAQVLQHVLATSLGVSR